MIIEQDLSNHIPQDTVAAALDYYDHLLGGELPPRGVAEPVQEAQNWILGANVALRGDSLTHADISGTP